MDIAALARKASRHCRPLAYLFIPLAKAADRMKRFGFRERIEENIALFCTPEQQRDRACLRRLRRDIWYCSILYSCSPLEYFLFRFSRLSHAGRQEFLCEHERRNLYRRISAGNPHGDAFWKKSAGYRLFSQYYGREVLPLDGQTPFEDFLAFVRRHPRFIVKPDSAAGGEGVHFEQLSGSAAPDALFDRLRRTPSVLEEPIIQSREVACFHPGSVNTLRLSTMTDGKKARVIFAFFKIGRGDSVVDNGAAGGILCPVDLQTGIISGPGVTERLETFLVHPETGLQITGFRIPRWQQAMDLAVRLAETEPAEWGVGWDLALTDGGWVLVECNRGGAVLGPQMISQQGMRAAVQPMLDHAARL